MERLRERYYLTYPKSLIREPLLYHLVKKFDLVFNIRGASVSESMGLVAVEFEGSSEQIERALAWLRQSGVRRNWRAERPCSRASGRLD